MKNKKSKQTNKEDKDLYKAECNFADLVTRKIIKEDAREFDLIIEMISQQDAVKKIKEKTIRDFLDYLKRYSNKHVAVSVNNGYKLTYYAAITVDNIHEHANKFLKVTTKKDEKYTI